MFDVTCPRHGHRVLLFSDQIRLENTTHGIEVHWTCSCGATGVEVLGALAEPTAPTPPATPTDAPHATGRRSTEASPAAEPVVHPAA